MSCSVTRPASAGAAARPATLRDHRTDRDARKGRRPSFVREGQGPEAEEAYEAVVEGLRSLGVATETGEFGAMMTVGISATDP